MTAFLARHIVPHMAAISLAIAQAKLDEWLTAESKVAESQAYSIAGRMMTRADLPAIAERIKYYSSLVDRLSRGGIRVRTGVPA